MTQSELKMYAKGVGDLAVMTCTCQYKGECKICKSVDSLVMATQVDEALAAGELPVAAVPRTCGTDSPAVLDWADVLAFARRTFPEQLKHWDRDDAQMITFIQGCWGEGPGHNCDGGNWWSCVVQPAYERQDKFALEQAHLKSAYAYIGAACKAMGVGTDKLVTGIHNLQDDVKIVDARLNYAKKVIENYAMDIRSRKDLVKQGFCQGSIYLEALADIAKVTA